MMIDLGLISIFQSIYEFYGSVTLAGGASTTKTFVAENAKNTFESYVSTANGISTMVTVSGSTVTIAFKNQTQQQISSNFSVRIGFSGE